MLNPFSFLKQDKLTKSKEFGRLSRLGRKMVSNYFVVLYTKNDLDYPRLGITASKKSAKLAVHRNRIKRVIREYFRMHKHDIGGFDIVIIARHSIFSVANVDFVRDLESVWQKLPK